MIVTWIIMLINAAGAVSLGGTQVPGYGRRHMTMTSSCEGRRQQRR
jgi:hypothetical protein